MPASTFAYRLSSWLHHWCRMYWLYITSSFKAQDFLDIFDTPWQPALNFDWSDWRYVSPLPAHQSGLRTTSIKCSVSCWYVCCGYFAKWDRLFHVVAPSLLNIGIACLVSSSRVKSSLVLSSRVSSSRVNRVSFVFRITWLVLHRTQVPMDWIVWL